MIRKKLKLTFVVLLIVMTFSLTVTATPIAWNAFIDQVEGTTLNPAQLAYSPYNFQLQLDLLLAQMRLNAWTVAEVIGFLQQEFWDEATKEEIMSAIKGDTITLNSNINSGIYLAIENTAIKSKLKINGEAGLDKDFLGLILHGFSIDDPESDYNLADLSFRNSYLEADAILDTAVSYSIPFQNLANSLGWESIYFGFGLHYLLGLGFAQLNTEKADVELIFDEENYILTGEGEISLLYSAITEGGVGHGIAGDVGLYGQITPQTYAGLAINNIGFINWSGVNQITATGNFSLDVNKLIADEDWFEYFYDNDLNPVLLTGSIRKATPINITCSLYHQLSPRIQLSGALRYNQGPSPFSEISVGSRLLFPKFLPLTIGADYQTNTKKIAFAAGLGLHLGGFEAFNITISDLMLLNGNSNSFSLGLNMALNF